ncbi:hypothetical protein PTKIN_Ptkin02bG0248900 [Pterospermum kingtungense]
MGPLSGVDLLLKGYRGTTLDGFYYICPLSNPNHSPKQNLVLPESFPKRGHFAASSCDGLLLLDDFDDEYGYTYTEDEMPVADGEDRVRLQVELYSLESDSWKPIPHPPLADPLFDSSAYIGGVHYWEAHGNSTQMFVLSFDYADEKFSSFPLPEDFVSGKCDAHLLEFGGSLAAVVYPFGKTETSFHIWVRNGESWTNNIVIGPVPGVQLLLGFSKNGEQMFREGSGHQLLLYDRASKELKDTGVPNDQPAIMQLIHYTESSVQLTGRKFGQKKIAP